MLITNWMEWMDENALPGATGGSRPQSGPGLPRLYRWHADAQMWVARWGHLVKTSIGWVAVANTKPHRPYKSSEL